MRKAFREKIHSFFVLVAFATASIIAKSILTEMSEEKIEDRGLQL